MCQTVESELSSESASAFNTELDSLNRKVKFLEEANNGLKKDYEEAVFENEEYLKHTAALDDKLATAEKLKNKLLDENKSLQIKNEWLNAENKSFRSENADLHKQVNSLNVAIKSSKKDLKEANHRFDKKFGDMEFKLKELTEYKQEKVSEEKEIKINLKKIDKKLKDIKEREARLEADKKKFDKFKRKEDLNGNQVIGKVVEEELNSTQSGSTFPSNKSDITNPTTIYTSLYTADITTYPSMASHWIAPAKSDIFDDSEFCTEFLKQFKKMMEKMTSEIISKK